MYSVGIDLIEINRIKKLMKHSKFLNKILSEREYHELEKKNFSPQSVAVNFCAKEAVLKAFGKGLGNINLKKIELLRKKSGQPYIICSEKLLNSQNELDLKFSVSATHTKKYASVIVILYA